MEVNSMNAFQNLLEQLEVVAEEVLTDQAEIVSLDKRRNANREALRAFKNANKKRDLEKLKPTTEKGVEKSVPIIHSSINSTNCWTCIGDMFMRMPQNVLVESMEEEQKQLDKAINDLRDGLRTKVNTLRELEGDEPSRGTNLSPLTKEEWAGVQHILND